MNCLKCQLPIESTPKYGLHVTCFKDWFVVSDAAEFIGLQRRASASGGSAIGLAPQNTSFFHGKFKKYSAELDGGSYILKMRQEDAPELPEVEYLCNQIGKLLGVPVADFFYIDFLGDKTFVTRNFIKHGFPADLQHIYHARPDTEHNCEKLIQVITEKTQRPYDVSVFIKTILFDAFIGNHDRHGRNLGFIVTGQNVTLAPIYDNVSYLSLESGAMLKADFNPRGKISTKATNEPSMKDYIVELKRLGYQDNINIFYRAVKLTKLYQIIDTSYCSLMMKQAIKNLIEKRFGELEDGLSS